MRYLLTGKKWQSCGTITDRTWGSCHKKRNITGMVKTFLMYHQHPNFTKILKGNVFVRAFPKMRGYKNVVFYSMLFFQTPMSF